MYSLIKELCLEKENLMKKCAFTLVVFSVFLLSACSTNKIQPIQATKAIEIQQKSNYEQSHCQSNVTKYENIPVQQSNAEKVGGVHEILEKLQIRNF